jgi:hemerythrin
MTRTLELGDPSLDTEHRELDALITRLADAAAERMLGCLDALTAHATEHFAAEDRDLREMKDGNANCHLDEHAAVLKSLCEVRGLVEADPTSEGSGRLVASLAGELRRWLPEHVLAMDAGIANRRFRRRLGGLPVVLTRRPSADGVTSRRNPATRCRRNQAT